MYVKICGLKTPESVAVSIRHGASAVGFVFAPGSPRTVTADLVLDLVATVPREVETVGVFRNQPLSHVISTARAAGLTTVQLHGDEPLTDILQLEKQGFRTFRAFSADAYSLLSPSELEAWASHRLLLDAVEPGAGETFDSTVLKSTPAGFWLLAGGLNPGNVASLIRAMRPSGVDVSSGVESSRGIKSVTLIADFIAAAREV